MPARSSAWWRKRRRQTSRRCRCWHCSNILSPAWAATRRHSGPGPAPWTGFHYAARGPIPGLDGIAKAIAHALEDARDSDTKAECRALTGWWANVAAALAPLEQVFAKPEIPLDDLIVIHLEAAERLSCADGTDRPVWRDADGEAAALFFDQLRAGATALPPFDPGAYPSLLRTLMMKAPVRPRFNRHRAIAILGPLEARLQSFDLTILGGLNEGSWPGAAPADPWFSRPMRKTLGLEQPERSIGLAAHDFAVLAAGRDVLLTRAAKAEGAPTIASRWLQRLTQLTAGLELDDFRRSLCRARPPSGRGSPQPPILAAHAQPAGRNPATQALRYRNRDLAAGPLRHLCPTCVGAETVGAAGRPHRRHGAGHRPAPDPGTRTNSASRARRPTMQWHNCWRSPMRCSPNWPFHKPRLRSGGRVLTRRRIGS